MSAEFVVTYRSPETASDTREAYNIALITLALEKTKAKYGDYRMQGMPQMNHLRSIYAIRVNMFPNILLEVSYSDKYLQNTDISYINFPVELGITGTRVCFARRELIPELEAVTHLEQLKKYSFGQGVGWEDVDILRANGFKVPVIYSYDSLFKLTASGRVDLFCRGASELKAEYEKYRHLIDIDYEKSFAIVYPLPRFFFTNVNNKLLKKRMEEGLRLAYSDGSLQRLWASHYADDIEFLNLHARKKFIINNPFIKALPKDYQQYWYDANNLRPLKGASQPH